jgi:DNA primase
MNIFSVIKGHVSVLDVVQEYTTLKKAGGYWKGHCPFHHEKTASFTVSPHKEIFYCFGCQAGGDVIAFISKIENCTPLEAARHLIERYNIAVPENLSHATSAENTTSRDRYFDLCKQVARWCHDNIRKSAILTSYLQERKINTETQNYFNLGYFPGGLQSVKHLIDYMQQYHVLAQDLIEAHILVQGKTVLYSPFEERLIFPITDHLGRLCGFGGRTFKINDQRPKYYNSRENDYFHKGTRLFGLDLARNKIQETGHVFLVEGYTDCTAMIQHGFTNTVATLGTACTINHLKILARYAQHLYVLYDGDTAGQQAIMRLTELCWKVNLELKVICLPAQEDPASFLAKNNDLHPLIANAQDIFLFFIASLGKEFNTQPLNHKVRVTRTLLETIVPIDDMLKQDFLLQKAAKTFEIPFETLKDELVRIRSASTQEPAQPTQAPALAITTPADPAVSMLEKRIFCAILHNIPLCNNSNINYVVEYMPGMLFKLLRTMQEQMAVMQEAFDFTRFFDNLTEQEKQYVSKILSEYQEKLDVPAFEQLILQLQKKQWKIITHTIKTKLAHAKNIGDEAQVQQLMNDFMELKRKMMTMPSTPTITDK